MIGADPAGSDLTGRRFDAYPAEKRATSQVPCRIRPAFSDLARLVRIDLLTEGV